MLYGDKQVFEGESPYQPSAMMMGAEPITVEDAAYEYGRLLVTGENFTEFSKVLADGQPLPTCYIDSEHIVVPIDADPPAAFTVAQVARDETVLSETEVFTLRAEEDNPIVFPLN